MQHITKKKFSGEAVKAQLNLS